ncbi:unnamed protein product [Fusarium graminearum]|nr:unnamed protein product [Fusarium graminearum]
MSIGIGPGDVLLFLRSVSRATTLLRGEAVDEYRTFRRACRDLEMVSRQLMDHHSRDTEHESPFRRQAREIKRLLIQFRYKIEKLDPSLGRYRTGTCKRVFNKLSWPSHARELGRLQQDLFYQWTIIDWKQKYCQNSFGTVSSVRNLYTKNCFDLEDHFGHVHRLDLLSTDSWKALHDCLTRMFPRGDLGYEIIQSHRYLLHKAEDFADVLCNSPANIPIIDAIKPKQRVMIRCVQNVVTEELQTFKVQPWNGPARDDSVDVRILIRDKMAQIGPIPPERSRATRPEIWHFSRVTLCNSQWPQFSDSTSRETASRLLVETRQGLERTTQFLKSQDLPFAWAAALINSRFWFARQEQALLRFVTSSLQALDHTMPRVVTPQNDAQLLDNLVYQLQAGIFDFLPERLEARCFLWMFWEVLQLESKILSSCARLLNTWSCPENYARQETPLIIKALTLPHIALLVPWRLTFDLAEDIVEYFLKKPPKFLPAAVRHLVMNSRSISLHYYIHGELSSYCDGGTNRQNVEEPIDRLYLAWMELAMRSEGEIIDSELTRTQIGSLVEGGYI